MKENFLTKLDIISVRNLQGISIPLSNTERKHLILTGKNGSGKTSTLEALKEHLNFVISNQYVPHKESRENYNYWVNLLNKPVKTEEERYEQEKIRRNAELYKNKIQHWESGVISTCHSFGQLREKYKNGELLLAYYSDSRRFQVESYKNIEKVEFETSYDMDDKPGNKLAKYLVNLKATQAFSKEKEETRDRAEKIEQWFRRFEEILREIFSDPLLRLDFDVTSFQFTIRETGHEPFDFNTLSSGYAAVLDIVNDLIMRMEAQSKTRDSFDMEGIVLIDEIETHLHLELQKNILPILTKLFPNLQFIITSHSPFVLSSLDHAVIYDLEKNILVEKGMQNLPYEGIVEGYFGADRLSGELRAKYDQYRNLVQKRELSDEEYEKLDELEYYLDEIPDYLASELTAEYSRLKLEFANRRQTNG
ncbi:MAG: AAA family ATPase [Lachnospiraceae bacterium]|nr:AAA family ATPase [Lachnospiraceae bacterium]